MQAWNGIGGLLHNLSWYWTRGGLLTEMMRYIAASMLLSWSSGWQVSSPAESARLAALAWLAALLARDRAVVSVTLAMVSFSRM